ncbi:MAG: PQQ-binding-like beta-propeller repeat protein [Planctomycetota bacterium]
MRAGNRIFARMCFVGVVFFLSANLTVVSAQENWPQFRGALAEGIGSGDLPTEWDVESGRNVSWKTAIPGLAHSSPVIWEDRIFLTSCVNPDMNADVPTGWLGGTGDSPEEEGEWTWQVVCVGRENGEILWTTDVASGAPVVQRHIKATHANCTCATDGKHVIAFFGSEGLYCLDFDGNLEWSRDLGRLQSAPENAPSLEWGFASSPVIFKDNVVVQCDCVESCSIDIFNIEDGSEIRKIEREEVSTWCTPAVFETDSGTQLVCNGFKQMAGYDFETGEQLWTLSGGGDIPVPTPLFANGLIYLTNGHGRSPTYAIEPDASGDLTPPEDSSALPPGLAWYQPEDGSYMPTPLVLDDLIYTCNDNGRLAVRDAMTGELVYRKRVTTGATFSGSAVATRSHLYFPAENGDVVVVKTGREFEEIAVNKFDETLMATPAIAGDELFVRTVGHLYCITESDE